jgi:hypothetical protein
MNPATPSLIDIAQLAAVTDIARHYGVTSQTVSTWRTRYARFPEPVLHLGGKPIYLMPDVERWHASRST